MFCTKCGKELDEGAKFCRVCGSPTKVVQTAAEPVQLPPTASSAALASKVQRLISSKNVDGLRELAGSGDNAVTDLLVDVLDKDPDPGAKVIAIDSLGLTSDPRAVRVLVAVFNSSTGDPRKIAAQSLANIVASRVRSDEAIPSLKVIAKDSSLDIMIRSQAARALCRFVDNDVEVEQFLAEIKNDPEEDLGIRMAATFIKINKEL